MGASAALGLSSERVRTGFSVRRSRYSARSFVSELSEAHAMDARVKVHNLTVSSLQEFQAVVARSGRRSDRTNSRQSAS